MKKIYAQRSSNILNSILPLNAIDSYFSILTASESQELFELWKTGKSSNTKEVIIPLSYNRSNLRVLQEKGYIKVDGVKVSFTETGSEAIKKIVLGQEDNSFKKQARDCGCQEKRK